MSHNLNITADGTAAMAYNIQNGMPWHSLGQSCEGAMTSEEALQLARLDYRVSKIPLVGTYQGGSKDSEIIQVSEAIKQMGIIREDTKAVLGIVGSKYTPIQNVESFAFFDDIVGAKEAMFETAGAIDRGQNVWIMAKLPEKIIVKRSGQEDDVSQCYVLLYNSHDGSSKVRIRFTPVRVVCQNTLTMALQGKCREVGIRHTKNAEAKMKEAHKILGIVKNEIKLAANNFQILADKRINSGELRAYLEQLYPLKKGEEGGEEESNTRRDNICNEITKLFESGKGNSGETAWDLYNGTVEFIDHFRTVKNQANKWENATFGSGLNIKNKAFELAMALAKD